MPDIDLEELKQLWAEHGAELATLIAEIATTGGPRFARAAKVGVPAVNALPELIARVERAEALLQEAIGRAEEIIERADTKAEDAGSDTEERAYYEGRMEAAIAISNTLTGDTPND